MTTVYMHPAIASALLKVEAVTNSTTWASKNEQQAELVSALPNLRAILSSLPAGLVESIGSTEASVINAWLAERGYKITLNEFGPEEFGVASSVDVTAKWTMPGDPIVITKGRVRAPAVLMSKGFRALAGADGRDVIAPDSNMVVLMTAAASLEDGLRAIAGDLPVAAGVAEAAFPMVDHDAEVDLQWLLGLSTDGAGLTQAAGHAKLRLNQFGARAKAAAAMGVTQPLVAFHVTEEAWRQPPELGTATAANGKRVTTW